MGRNIFIAIALLILMAAIPLGVYLTQQQQDLLTRADSDQTSKINWVNITGGSTSDRQVQLNLIFVPTTDQSGQLPTAIRLANSVTQLADASEQPFSGNNQTIDWTLSPGNGQKTVYLQFKLNNEWLPPVFNSILLVGQPDLPSPTPAVIIEANYDLNNDQSIDQQDVVIMRQKLQDRNLAADDQADFNQDGVVNSQDYTLLLRQITP